MSDKIILKLGDKTAEIEQDDNGRYSLNDLFKASEAPKSKKPNEFLRYKGSNVQVLKIPSGGISRPTDLQKTRRL